VWLFFQPADESARPWQSYVKVVDPEEQEEAVSRLGVVGACQRRMLVGTPLMETEQYRSIRVRRFWWWSLLRRQVASLPGNTLSAFAAKAATTTVPIVLATGDAENIWNVLPG
jgi:DNA-directed RNA polymerase subunit N (RpoN/RPB10)